MSCSLSKVRIQQIKSSARLCYITYPQLLGAILWISSRSCSGAPRNSKTRGTAAQQPGCSPLSARRLQHGAQILMATAR